MPGARWKSFGHAANGLWRLLREPNAKIHLIATLVVLAVGFAKKLNRTEWCIIIIVISIVWITEAINTAIEKLCDLYSTSFHPLIKQIKDVAAAAVFLAAIATAIVGFIIFFF